MVMLSALQSPEVESSAWLEPFVADFRCAFTCSVRIHNSHAASSEAIISCACSSQNSLYHLSCQMRTCR